MIRYLIVASMMIASPALAEDQAVFLQPAPAMLQPPDSTGAMAAANAVMAAIGAKDEAALTTLILPQAMVLSQSYAADGGLKTRVRSRDEWLAGLKSIQGTPSEVMSDPRLLIARDLAHVWAPYTFDIDGKRSHCGIDSLGLARIDGQWRITSMTWTAEPGNCPQ